VRYHGPDSLQKGVFQLTKKRHNNSPISKNQLIDLTITGLSHEGNGVGRYGDMVVFVSMAAPGDALRVKIVKVLSTHAFAIIHAILTPSTHRIADDCPVYSRCGGCSLRHLSYDAEITVKSGWVTDNLRRIGGVVLPMDAPLPSPHSARYRNKAQYPIRRVNGRLCAGFFARRSHALVPVTDCLLQPAIFSAITAAFLSFLESHDIEPYDEADHSGLIRHLYLRRAGATGQVMVCIVVNGAAVPHEEALVAALLAAYPDIATVVLNTNRRRDNVILGDHQRNLYGNGTISDILCGVKVTLSPASFYQVNREAAENLYQKALEYADPGPDDILLDLYCGTGTIGLSMAARVGHLIGVELAGSAVRDARLNAAQNGVANAAFIEADAGDVLSVAGERPTIVVLDPPRKGVDKGTLEAVAAMGPKKIVYISCNSATLARDCAILAALGYKAVKAGAVDMFPRTAHVEAVALLEQVL
jgi:23S rRNA (uracil1939-C5)-methyltransferase